MFTWHGAASCVALGQSAHDGRGCERLERANKTPAGLTDAGWRRTGARAQEHAPGNACDPMCGHGLRICAHPRESCHVQPATEDEEQVARRLVHADRLAQAPAQAAQVRQWGSAPRQKRALRLHRWSWQTSKRTCWALDSSPETGSAHSGVVADISPGRSELQTPRENDLGRRQRPDKRRQRRSAKSLPSRRFFYIVREWRRGLLIGASTVILV